MFKQINVLCPLSSPHNQGPDVHVLRRRRRAGEPGHHAGVYIYIYIGIYIYIYVVMYRYYIPNMVYSEPGHHAGADARLLVAGGDRPAGRHGQGSCTK